MIVRLLRVCEYAHDRHRPNCCRREILVVVASRESTITICYSDTTAGCYRRHRSGSKQVDAMSLRQITRRARQISKEFLGSVAQGATRLGKIIWVETHCEREREMKERKGTQNKIQGTCHLNMWHRYKSHPKRFDWRRRHRKKMPDKKKDPKDVLGDKTQTHRGKSHRKLSAFADGLCQGESNHVHEHAGHEQDVDAADRAALGLPVLLGGQNLWREASTCHPGEEAGRGRRSRRRNETERDGFVWSRFLKRERERQTQKKTPSYSSEVWKRFFPPPPGISCPRRVERGSEPVTHVNQCHQPDNKAGTNKHPASKVRGSSCGGFTVRDADLL